VIAQSGRIDAEPRLTAGLFRNRNGKGHGALHRIVDQVPGQALLRLLRCAPLGGRSEYYTKIRLGPWRRSRH
jgi:hypothetical protein